MGLMRLTYFSTLKIDFDKNNTLRQLTEILDAASRNNSRNEITGALIFDENWFVQILEGERDAIWPTFKRIENDHRHSNVTLIEMALASGRCFGNWWMACKERTSENSRQFAPFMADNIFDPSKMLPEQILSLMINLTHQSPARQLNRAGKDMESLSARRTPNKGGDIAASL